jgi:hypothetical protein
MKTSQVNHIASITKILKEGRRILGRLWEFFDVIFFSVSFYDKVATIYDIVIIFH